MPPGQAIAGAGAATSAATAAPAMRTTPRTRANADSGIGVVSRRYFGNRSTMTAVP